MDDKFTIIAAPRTPNGSYWMTDGNPVYVKEFSTESKMQDYWRSQIVPKTSTRSGLAFEISMFVTSKGQWKLADKSRYSDTPLMTPKDEGYNMMTC